MRRLPWLVVLVLIMAGSGHASEVPSQTEDALEAWLRAHAARDTEQARRLATARHLDPSALGDALVAKQLAATAPAFAREDLVLRLGALRADAGARPGLTALDRLIERLAAMDREAMAREHRWHEAAARMRAVNLRTEAGRAAAKKTADAMRDVPRPPGSHAVWWVEHQRGRAAHLAGEADEAGKAYAAALAHAARSGLHVPAARSALAAALLAREHRNGAQAVTHARESLRHAARVQEARGIREAVTLLARMHMSAGRHAEAARVVAAHMPSLTLHRRREQHAYYLMAFNVQSQGNQPTASLVTAQRMHANARAWDVAHAVAEALRSLGHAKHMLGREAEAIRHFEAALAHDLSRRPRLARLIHADLSEIWQELGRYDDAEAAARKALALSRAGKRPADEAQDLLHLAQALGGQERWEDALASAQRALGLSVRSGNIRRMGEARREVAVLYWRAGKAPQAFALLEASRATFAHLDDPVAEVYTLWLTGVYRTLQRDFAEALVLAERSAALLHPAHAFHTRIARLRAAALYGLRRHREAVAAAHASVEASRRMLVGLAPSDTLSMQRSLASAASYGMLSARELAARAEGDAAGPWVDEAFWLLESSRAIQLNMALRDVRTRSMESLSPALSRAEQTTRADVADAHAQLVRLATSAEAEPEAIRRAQEALEDAWKTRDTLVARIERVSRRAGVAAAGRPIARAAFASLLADDEVYVAWIVAGERMLAVLVRKDTRQLVDLGARTAIEADVATWRRALATPGADDTAAARRLYARLLAPLRPHLQAARRLIVAPGGALAAVPLAALIETKAPKVTRLVESFEILYVPSATSYAILSSEARAPGRGLLAVAAPSYDDAGLPALPHAATEALRVAEAFEAQHVQQLVGAKASLARLEARTEALTQPLRALHIAAHGFVDPRSPRRSGVVLAGGAMLRVDHVRRMVLPSDLVVLSCCDSAQGTPTAGEGQRGLVRAFLVAGGRRVVASCWRVSDEATPDFMALLYRAWHTEGVSLPGALRAAQLARLRAGGRAAHPYTWATFVAWGVP